MRFAHPLFLLLILILPLALWWRKRAYREAAFLYSSVGLVKGMVSLTGSPAELTLKILRWLAVVLMIVGLARPQRGEGRTTISASGIDISVALDLSGSMRAEDFEVDGNRVNRADIAKTVLTEFVEKRPNDRIGLVAFAGRAYVASPLTLDHEFLLQNMDRLNLNMRIEEGTAIGSALATCLNRLKDIESKSKIVILMTDGQNTAGKVPPSTAAEAAETLGVKVYTIGVGTRGDAPMPYVDAFGTRRYRKVPVDIDEDTLKKISDRTGGKYYRADNTDALRSIYDEIDQLEKTEIVVKKYQRYDELFPMFVIPALALLLLEVALAQTVWRKLP
jgi:Ca-activated chloride channel family protein